MFAFVFYFLCMNALAGEPVPTEAASRIAAVERVERTLSGELEKSPIGRDAMTILREYSHARLKALLSPDDQKVSGMPEDHSVRFLEIQRGVFKQLIMGDVIRKAVGLAAVSGSSEPADFDEALKQTLQNTALLRKHLEQSLELSQEVFLSEMTEQAEKLRTERVQAIGPKARAAKVSPEVPPLVRDRLTLSLKNGPTQLSYRGPLYGTDRESFVSGPSINMTHLTLRYRPDYFSTAWISQHEKSGSVFDPQLGLGLVYLPVQYARELETASRQGTAPAAKKVGELDWSRLDGLIVAPFRIQSSAGTLDLLSIQLLSFDKNVVTGVQRLGSLVNFGSIHKNVHMNETFSFTYRAALGVKPGQQKIQETTCLGAPVVADGQVALQADFGKLLELMGTVQVLSVGTLGHADLQTVEGRAEALAKFKFMLGNLPASIGVGAGYVQTRTTYESGGSYLGESVEQQPYGTFMFGISPALEEGKKP